MIAFALAASLPLAVGAWLWERRLDPLVDRLEEERLARARAVLVEEARAWAEGTEAHLGLVSERLAGDSSVIDALLVGRAETLERRLGFHGEPLALDALLVLDGKGAIVADADGIRRRLGGAGTWAEAVDDEVVWQRAEGELWSLASRELRMPDGRRFRIVGARVVDDEAMERVSRLVGAPVSVTGGADAVSGEGAVSVGLPGSDGRPAARWLARVDLSRERALGQSLWRQTLVAVIVGVVVSALVGAWLAGRVNAPVSRLTRAMEGVATGEWDLSLPAEREGLGRLSDAFNRMIAALARSRREALAAERRAAWREAARRVAHEVKNPLTPIRGAVENLRKARGRGPEVLDGVFEVETATVLEEVERLRRLVDEFSRFARMPAPRVEDTDLAALVTSVARRRVPEAGSARLGLDVSDLPAVPCDADQVAAILDNLIGNGVDAMGEDGGRIEVRAREVAEGGRRFAEVLVRDQGPGIPAEDREKIFQPYFTTKRRRGGTGLGLAIALQVAREHGGSLEMVDDGQPGAAFRLRLPLHRAEG
jgi:signal transduction histidine kinase